MHSERALWLVVVVLAALTGCAKGFAPQVAAEMKIGEVKYTHAESIQLGTHQRINARASMVPQPKGAYHIKVKRIYAGVEIWLTSQDEWDIAHVSSIILPPQQRAYLPIVTVHYLRNARNQND